MEERGIGTTRRRCPGGAVTTTRLEYRVNMPVSLDPTVGSRPNVFHEFTEDVSMEERGIGTTRRRCPGGVVTPTGQEYRVKRPVSLDPTVRSRSNFFHEFP